VEFPKIARLSREVIITEKIDGTNASICITEDGQFLTGSRTRWITPTDDNYGFSKWAHEHREELMTMGVGTYMGEWWGSGIQRGYGLPKGEKRWSLFNTTRWCPAGTIPKTFTSNAGFWEQDILPECVSLVPVLYQGTFRTNDVDAALEKLRANGSVASPGFMNPEGVVVFHTAANLMFKKTILKDEVPKSRQ
jgi:hypothetical protein